MSFTKIPAPTYRTVDFTSSGTWVCPSGVYSAEFFVVGAGGAGGGVSTTGATNYAVGCGGGGGAVKKVNLAVTPGNSYTITIGGKGTGSSGAIGGNGGFSEVLLSGTSLIKAYGGQGGGACVADAATRPTTSRTIGGASGEGGAAGAAPRFGAGGGGAINGSSASFAVSVTNTRNYSSEGTGATISSLADATAWQSVGQGGIDGYGAGGSGGLAITTAPATNYGNYSAFAGAGALVTSTGASNGGNAVANTGCGGGGAASHTSSTSVAGGNGADGLVRISYFA